MVEERCLFLWTELCLHAGEKFSLTPPGFAPGGLIPTTKLFWLTPPGHTQCVYRNPPSLYLAHPFIPFYLRCIYTLPILFADSCTRTACNFYRLVGAFSIVTDSCTRTACNFYRLVGAFSIATDSCTRTACNFYRLVGAFSIVTDSCTRTACNFYRFVQPKLALR